MSAPVLNSVSPVFGPPGTAITLTGSGFNPAAQVGCPVYVPTTWVSATQLTAVIPADLTGPEGRSMLVAVYVSNPDGTSSAQQIFTVLFPSTLQTYTTIDLVIGEVPGFSRGGGIPDSTIFQWLKTTAQALNGMLARRNLPLDPSQWAQPDPTTGQPNPQAILENIVRLGVAAKLAAAVQAQFGTADSGLAKSLNAAYMAECKLVMAGEYDPMFNPARAATVETGTLGFGGVAGVGRFYKDQRF